jgi:hypothetical protein
MATSLGRCKIQGPGPGRPKGSMNRLTNLKEAFVEAFDKTGGVMHWWSGLNRTAIVVCFTGY